jgi:OmpA-OmpF porin, OOP family
MRGLRPLFVILLQATNIVAAQNLVPNPSFEEYKVCPGSYSRIREDFRLNDWYSPNNGTPDAFNTCGKGESGVPYNWAGFSGAYDGKGYAGIYAYIRNRDFREYLQCKLSEALIQDTTYRISFRYRLSTYSMLSIDRMGALLGDSALTVRHDHAWDIAPSVSFKSDAAFHTRTGTWERAYAEYKAKGNERFLTIGNFSTNDSTSTYEIIHRVVQEPMLSDAAYYYIDDVIVRQKYDPTEIIPDIPYFREREIVLNERYVLNNILFEFDSYRLLPRSFDELDQVVAVLRRNPSYKVHISGHTDDVGGDKYNLQLSRKRAQSVLLYLKAEGVAENRVQSSGYGKSIPLVASTSDEARRVNRRVELRFFE